MRRTLIVTLEYPPVIGGIATYVDQLAQSLPEDQVLLLAPKHKDAPEFDSARAFRIIRKNPYFPPFIWPRWLRLYISVKKLVRQYGIEVLHVHHILPVGTVAYLLKRSLGIPYILFSHGTDVVAAGATPRKRKVAAKVALGAERVVMNSKNLEQRLHDAFPELKEHTTVVYPCPNRDFFEPTDAALIEDMRAKYALEGKKVILTITRMIPSKGLRHLVNMMPAILSRLPHLVWFIVGTGPEKDELLALIRKFHLQNIVRFIGEVPHEELKSYYHLADVFVLLTHPYQGMEEGLGLVFLEASAAGLPIVAGRSGGVQEAVLHNETGLVIDVDEDPEQIIDAIVELLEHPERARALGEAGRRRMQTEFQWNTQLSKIEQWL